MKHPTLTETDDGSTPILTPLEVAKILRVSKATVLREIERGNLNAFKVGKQFRVFRSDLDEFVMRSRPA